MFKCELNVSLKVCEMPQLEDLSHLLRGCILIKLVGNLGDHGRFMRTLVFNESIYGSVL
jgi:hypothetical protein